MTGKYTKDEVLANDPRPTFDAHLFERSEVEAADGAIGSQADRPVSSVCDRTTAYGPFREPDDALGDDGGLCSVCASAVEGEDDEGGDA